MGLCVGSFEMRTSVKATIATAILVAAAIVAGAAGAAPIIGSGSVSMAGGFTPVGGSGSDLSGATGVHFLPAGAGNVTVTNPGGSGSFSSLTTGITGTIHDFSFAPFSVAGHFLTIGAFTFDLNSVSVVAQNSAFLDLHGTAMVSESGFADTQASFDFSGQGGGAPATFSWSATAAASAVPEPMTLGILGIGLAGYGVLRRPRAA
jgi:hypothetical protein